MRQAIVKSSRAKIDVVAIIFHNRKWQFSDGVNWYDIEAIIPIEATGYAFEDPEEFANWTLQDAPKVTIVKTRRKSDIGKEMAEELGLPLLNLDSEEGLKSGYVTIDERQQIDDLHANAGVMPEETDLDFHQVKNPTVDVVKK